MARYIYHNQNPDGDIENDCVTRALSLAFNVDYSEIRKQLYYTGKLLNCERLCICCYKFLIEDVYKCKRVNCDGMYPDDFADLYPEGTYLIRMNGHICTCIDGKIYDIFDSRFYDFITDAWKVD